MDPDAKLNTYTRYLEEYSDCAPSRNINLAVFAMCGDNRRLFVFSSDGKQGLAYPLGLSIEACLVTK